MLRQPEVRETSQRSSQAKARGRVFAHLVRRMWLEERPLATRHARVRLLCCQAPDLGADEDAPGENDEFCVRLGR